MKFYVGDEVEINTSYSCEYGTVTGFYNDGKPRIVGNGRVINYSEFTWADRKRWAITKPSPEREKVAKFFNQRNFIERLCYLFTGKMP